MQDHYPRSTPEELKKAIAECVRQNFPNSEYAVMMRESLEAKTTLTKESYAEGKWMIYTAKPYPRRVGHVIGGNHCYLAEAGPKVIGYFKTINEAMQAIKAQITDGIQAPTISEGYKAFNGHLVTAQEAKLYNTEVSRIWRNHRNPVERADLKHQAFCQAIGAHPIYPE